MNVHQTVSIAVAHFRLGIVQILSSAESKSPGRLSSRTMQAVGGYVWSMHIEGICQIADQLPQFFTQRESVVFEELVVPVDSVSSM